MGCASSKHSVDEKFLQACEQGDLRTVHDLLPGPTGAAPAVRGPTPAAAVGGLHLAAAAGHLAVIRRLLSVPYIATSINARDALGMTPLAWAAVAGEARAADKLLRSGADSNIVDNEGSSPLMLALAAPLWRLLYAAEIKQDGLVSAISRVRGLPEAVAAQEYEHAMAAAGWTPAAAAQAARAQYGALYCGIARDLLRFRSGSSSGGSIASFTNHGAAPSRAKSTLRSSHGATALSHAAALGHTNAVLLLIAGGRVDVNERGPKGVTALQRAAGLGHPDLVDILLANGADKDAASDSGMTPLMWAADGGHGDIVRALATRGAALNAVSRDGATALLLALSKASHSVVHEELCNVLLQNGANPSIGTFCGKTALHFAVERGSEHLVLALLARGARTGAVSASGDTPLLLALQNQRSGIVTALLRRGGDLGLEAVVGTSNALSLACESGDLQLVRALLRAGVSANAVLPDGNTPLLLAARSGHAVIIEALIDNGGADIDASTVYGSTALMLATLAPEETASTAAVAVLLARGADAAQRNVYGNTPLIVALSHGKTAIVDMLLQSRRHLDVNAVNEEGYSALDYICKIRGDWDQVRNRQKLIELGAIPRPVAAPVVAPPPEPEPEPEPEYETVRERGSSGGGGGGGGSFARTAWGIFRAVHTGLEIGFTIAELLGGI